MRRRDEVASDLPDTSEDSDGRRHLKANRIFFIALASFFIVGAAWSEATPLLAAPDEPSQIVKAASVARGVWTARCYDVGPKCVASTSSALGFEEVPTFYDLVRAPDAADNGAHSQICFKRKTTPLGALPASCARSLNTLATPLEIKGYYNIFASTYQARYPPLYFAIVGLPTYLRGSSVDIYLMRLLSALLSAIFLALALTAAVVYSRNRAIVIGLVVAATPMVFFLGGVVNPSGLEISSGIALWTTGAILFTERLAAPPRGLVAMFGASAVTMELVRPLSPLWLALSVVFLVACSERAALLRALRTRSVQICIVFVGLFGLVAVWWIVAVHATDLYLGVSSGGVPSSVSTWTIFETALRHNTYYIPDMIGVFGWFDTYAPSATYVLWYVFLGGLAVAAAIQSWWRGVVLGIFGIAILVIPAVIETSHAHAYGYTWSGRDLLPFAVGLPILASSSLRTRSAGRAKLSGRQFRLVTTIVIVLAALAQFAAFYEALRRYAVGTTGPIFGFLRHPIWHPAIGILGALALGAVALAAVSMTYWLALRERPSIPADEVPAATKPD
jgi:hypothetical protein